MAQRTRNFATVVYPESAPIEWKKILQEHFIPAFVSPLHNADCDAEGVIKKEHYHVVLMFDSVKTQEQAKEVFDTFNGVGIEVVKSIRAYCRYLCHLDSPDKVQYSIDDVECYAGADYLTTIGLAADRYKAIGEMIDYCEGNDIDSYAQLLLYAKKHRFDWFRVLCDKATLTMVYFLRSRTWERTRVDNNRR